MFSFHFRSLAVLAVALSITACGKTDEASSSTKAPAQEQIIAADPITPTIDDIVAGPWRSSENAKRDGARHPVETLAFFGLTNDMTVVEISPGGGWYTEIIAPFIAGGAGEYVAAGYDPDGANERTLAAIARFEENFVSKPDIYGDVIMTGFSATSGSLVAEGSADMVLSFRNVHSWMGRNYAAKAFDDFYAALKPGGVLGVVEHRARGDAPQDTKAGQGYVRQDYVIALAEAAGFELAGTSEINANPADTADHPYGVWTLPPRSATSRGGVSVENFDPVKYLAIGESDRMTVKFRKPLAADGAMLE